MRHDGGLFASSAHINRKMTPYQLLAARRSGTAAGVRRSGATAQRGVSALAMRNAAAVIKLLRE
jgi:hypothetical protein